MSYDNPNPSGWRSGSFFIDLSRVVATAALPNKDGLQVLFAGSDYRDESDGFVHFIFDDEEIDSFLQALEVYHSKR
jgi:hypothetical protein